MRDQLPTKSVVTVSEMARMVGLSRARFYQLIECGVFLPPVHCVSTRRPMYVEEMQRTCLEVRRRNHGVNGRPVLFYSAPSRSNGPTKKKSKAEHTELIAGLSGLGLPATAEQVTDAISSLYPNGVNGHSQADMLRAVFLHLKRRNPTDKVGR